MLEATHCTRQCPPNGQGLTALLALGILEALQEKGLCRPLLEMEHNSPEYLHTLVEALRLAFADSQWYVTDPEFSDIPVEQLLSKVSCLTRDLERSLTSRVRSTWYRGPSFLTHTRRTLKLFM